MDLPSFSAHIAEQHGLVVVSTARADGTIQSSLVTAGVLAHPVSGVDVIGFVTYGPAKLANLRARPWATLTGVSGWRWATAEGDAEIAGPDDPLPGVPDSDVPALLRAVFTAAGGTHDDWDEFDRTMARDRRAAVLVRPGRVYGQR
jgi:PPOX class probable F420-dependent enzyme